jgi:hypothetical protein
MYGFGGGLNGSTQHSGQTRLALKTKAKSLARVRSAGTLPNANCHLGGLDFSKGKLGTSGTEPSGGGKRGGRAVLSAFYWRSYAIIVAVAIVFDLLLPYGFDRFRIFATVVGGGLLALYATPLFRSK